MLFLYIALNADFLQMKIKILSQEKYKIILSLALSVINPSPRVKEKLRAPIVVLQKKNMQKRWGVQHAPNFSVIINLWPRKTLPPSMIL